MRFMRISGNIGDAHPGNIGREKTRDVKVSVSGGSALRVNFLVASIREGDVKIDNRGLNFSDIKKEQV